MQRFQQMVTSELTGEVTVLSPVDEDRLDDYSVTFSYAPTAPQFVIPDFFTDYLNGLSDQKVTVEELASKILDDLCPQVPALRWGVVVEGEVAGVQVKAVVERRTVTDLTVATQVVPPTNK